MAVQIQNITDLKRQPVNGFPVPMNKQMNQSAKKVRRHKVKFPHPSTKGGK